ncbi:MAG: hypothetical protein AAF415_19195 [Pseudomonadota bacterium]
MKLRRGISAIVAGDVNGDQRADFQIELTEIIDLDRFGCII